jgi:spore maturation protein CgeB
MKLVAFGLSLSSSWGNGHATTYRALLRAFAARGHDVTFFEWDAPWYGGPHRDLPEPDFCRLALYPAWESIRDEAIAHALEADATIVGSYVRDGIRLIDDLANAGVEPLAFYDIDTPVTIAGLLGDGVDYLAARQVPLFTHYLSFTGGPILDDVLERRLGARSAVPLHCSVDPDRYRPVATDPRFTVDLAYMGTYAADRQPALDRLLVEPARRMPDRSFLVAGPQYPERPDWPANVRRCEHVPPDLHAALYSSAAWQLNVTREAMVASGWSPSVRLFEAAACGAALISDRWAGMEQFLEPGREILISDGAEAVIAILEQTHPDDRRAIGAAARARILASHTAAHRAAELEARLTSAAAVA